MRTSYNSDVPHADIRSQACEPEHSATPPAVSRAEPLPRPCSAEGEAAVGTEGLRSSPSRAESSGCFPAAAGLAPPCHKAWAIPAPTYWCISAGRERRKSNRSVIRAARTALPPAALPAPARRPPGWKARSADRPEPGTAARRGLQPHSPPRSAGTARQRPGPLRSAPGNGPAALPQPHPRQGSPVRPPPLPCPRRRWSRKKGLARSVTHSAPASSTSSGPSHIAAGPGAAPAARPEPQSGGRRRGSGRAGPCRAAGSRRQQRPLAARPPHGSGAALCCRCGATGRAAALQGGDREFESLSRSSCVLILL